MVYQSPELLESMRKVCWQHVTRVKEVLSQSVPQVSGTGPPGRKRQIFRGSDNWGENLVLNLVSLYVSYTISRRICREKKQFSGATRILVQNIIIPDPNHQKYAGNPLVRNIWLNPYSTCQVELCMDLSEVWGKGRVIVFHIRFFVVHRDGTGRGITIECRSGRGNTVTICE